MSVIECCRTRLQVEQKGLAFSLFQTASTIIAARFGYCERGMFYKQVPLLNDHNSTVVTVRPTSYE